MDFSPNMRAWLDGAPPELGHNTRRLLGRVAELRCEQDVYPAQDAILRALDLTGPQDVRVVILGQDPYHEPGQAMGLAFSVPAGQRLPPSLRNVYRELADDLGCGLPTSGDLTSWATQGVLLLNTTLTVRAHEAGSHASLGWQELTGHVVARCLRLPQTVVFLAWGRHAARLVDDVRSALAQAGTPARDKHVLASTHPSPLSARRASAGLPAFMGSRPFSRANALLEAAGCAPVRWESVLDEPGRGDSGRMGQADEAERTEGPRRRGGRRPEQGTLGI